MAALSIDLGKRVMQVGDKTVKEGDFISIDGTYSIVIPRERTPVTAYISFMDALLE